MSLRELRRAYRLGALSEGDLPADPVELFGAWMEHAVRSGELEPNAVALATVGADGQPRARFVLLKDAREEGFVFFTNYESRKGRDLAEVPRASLAFWWPMVERQVRVDGRVSRLSGEESDAYFRSRPRGSQLSARAAHQSEPVGSREELISAVERLEREFPAGDVPRPDYWGGYLLEPERLEFWQGREDRLHDRFEYRRGGGAWSWRRLAP